MYRPAAAHLDRWSGRRDARAGGDGRVEQVLYRGGQFTGQDRTALAELAKFEKANPRSNRPLPRPDPYNLARGYLEKAGFEGDLASVEPLVQAAERNVALERQFKGMLPQSNWAP